VFHTLKPGEGILVCIFVVRVFAWVYCFLIERLLPFPLTGLGFFFFQFAYFKEPLAENNFGSGFMFALCGLFKDCIGRVGLLCFG
jgi:hypothetical protein